MAWVVSITDAVWPAETRPDPPSASLTPFSLFEGDVLNRAFGRIGLNSRRTLHIAGRCLLVVVATWLPLAVLSFAQQLYSDRIEARNFFADFAAYAQFLIALPLFIIGERVVSRNTREAAKDFVDTGVVDPDDMPVVDRSHRLVERLRRAWLAEVICIGAAIALAFATVLTELRATGMETWHTGAGRVPRVQIDTVFGLTWPGLWLMLFSLPILNYWWLRLAWKVIIWTWYLYRMSRLRLMLVASHPDQTGGIGFISNVQAKFAIIIFAYGISNVAAVLAYKVAIERAPLLLPPVWGPALGFVIVAPMLFTVPLLMFTKQLFRVKRRALNHYREHVMRRARAFESQWLNSEDQVAHANDLLINMNNLAAIFGRIEQMRVIPFDLKSAVQLLASTVGSVATVLPILKIEGPLENWLELLSTMLGR